MPSTLSTEAGLKIGPVILETLVKHYFTRKYGKAAGRRVKGGRITGNLRQDEVLYDSAFTLAKTFMEAATKHTVEDLQQFSNTRTPSPPWTHVVRVLIPLSCAEDAALHLIRALGGEEVCKHVVGGTKWWQVRGVKGIDGQWITARKDWQAAEKRRKQRSMSGSASPSDAHSRSRASSAVRREGSGSCPLPASRGSTGSGSGERERGGDEKAAEMTANGDLGAEAEATYEPEMDALRCILYFHGGGYYFGSVDQERYSIQRMARKLKGRVFAVNYRLAPQYPFPCAIQDALAAYLYLIRPPPTASHSPVSPAHIILAGDSAGGGLVLALLQVIRDAGSLPMPAGAVLISPWCDLTHSFESIHDNTDTDVVPKTGLSLHKPSILWPPPPSEITTRVHEGLRARVKRIVRLQLDHGVDQSASPVSAAPNVNAPSSFRFKRGNRDRGAAADGSGASSGSNSGTASANGHSSPNSANGANGQAGTGGGGAKVGRSRSHSASHTRSNSVSALSSLHPHLLRHNRSYQNMKANGYAGGRTASPLNDSPPRQGTPPPRVSSSDGNNMGITVSPPMNPSGSQEISLIASNGDALCITDQVQLYAPNTLLAHPLVSPCMGFLGGLCPLLVIAGEKEVLRDEIIYAAHRAARPEKYPIKEEIRKLYPALERIEESYGPTRVHLQVYDEAAHVLPVLFPFTTPAKYCFRAMAVFMKHVTGVTTQPPKQPHSSSTSQLLSVPPHLNAASSGGESDYSDDDERSQSRTPREDRPFFNDGPLMFSPAPVDEGDLAVPFFDEPLSESGLPSPLAHPSTGQMMHAPTNGLGNGVHTSPRLPPLSTRLTSSLPGMARPGSNGSGSRSWTRNFTLFDSKSGSTDADVAGPQFKEGSSANGPGTAGALSAYDSPKGISPFRDNMIRERISTQGIIRPLEPEHELAPCRMRPEQVGHISERSARRYLEGKAAFDRKFNTKMKSVSKIRDRNLEAAKKESMKTIAQLQMDLFQDVVPSGSGVGLDKSAKKGVKEGLYAMTGAWTWAWALDADERPPPSSIVARRDTEEARRLGKIADQAILPQEKFISGNSLWSLLINFLTASPEREKDGIEEEEEAPKEVKEGRFKLRRKSTYGRPAVASPIEKEGETSSFSLGVNSAPTKRNSTLFEKLLPRPRNVATIFSSSTPDEQRSEQPTPSLAST